MTELVNLIKSQGIPCAAPDEPLFCITGEDRTGSPAYYLVRVNPLHSARFYHIIKNGVDSGLLLDLERYGEVIASGYGEPPAALKERMRPQSC